jgi:hypothetical protein
MSLTFLVPLFLLGLAGIAVPIVVHLTRRQRKNVVMFPSLMFLEKVPYQEQRRRRVQHWFLLAMRAAALALLAIAFARPFMDDTALGAGASGGPREVVVLVDQSYSMELGDQLAVARDGAAEVFAGLGWRRHAARRRLQASLSSGTDRPGCAKCPFTNVT